MPYNQQTHVEKIFDLSPLPMGLMFTGIASIGDRTIRDLVAEFRANDATLKKASPPANYTVRAVANRLLRFLRRHYDDAYPGPFGKPGLELLIGG